MEAVMATSMATRAAAPAVVVSNCVGSSVRRSGGARLCMGGVVVPVKSAFLGCKVHVCTSSSSGRGIEKRPLAGKKLVSASELFKAKPVAETEHPDVKIDLQLPRRRLLVEFTCNVCQTRTQRLINPDAYKRGTVYVQCGGCEVYHQLVDNLDLVVEYDFREEASSDSSQLT